MGQKMETPARGQAQPGLENRYADAAGTQNLAQDNAKRHGGGTVYRVTPSAGEPFEIAVKGRTKWALDKLRRVGEQGLTSVENPAPRLSAYVHTLRELGVEIETVHEKHGGDYPGVHGVYILRSEVSRATEGGDA